MKMNDSASAVIAPAEKTGKLQDRRKDICAAAKNEKRGLENKQVRTEERR
jgi:hypothetical protein